jgi:hypothetical protein
MMPDGPLDTAHNIADRTERLPPVQQAILPAFRTAQAVCVAQVTLFLERSSRANTSDADNEAPDECKQASFEAR